MIPIFCPAHFINVIVLFVIVDASAYRFAITFDLYAVCNYL